MQIKQRVTRKVGRLIRTGIITRITGVFHYVLWDDEAKGVIDDFTGKRVPAQPYPYLAAEIKPA